MGSIGGAVTDIHDLGFSNLVCILCKYVLYLLDSYMILLRNTGPLKSLFGH